MTHDSAVRTIVQLVPEIEKKGAYKVLRDYAVKEDLPPAQLEKLAQVFNTLRTVSHIEKAADRGSSVELVDVPTLIVDYAALDAGQEKKALSPVSSSTHSPWEVDLMSAMRSEIAGPKAEHPMAKAAAAPALKVTSCDISEGAMELAVEARMEMSKLAGELIPLIRKSDGDGDYYDISGNERDALASTPEHLVKGACDWLAETIKLMRKPYVRHDYNKTLAKQAFAVGSSATAKLVELCDAVHLHSLMEKLAAEVVTPGPMDGKTKLPSADVGALADAAGKLEGPAREQFLQTLRDQGIELETAETATETETETAETGGAKTGLGALQASKDRSNVSTDEASGGGPSGGGKGTKPAQSAGPSTGSGESSNIFKSMRKLVGGATASTAGAIQSSAAKADELLTRITTKERQNSSQKHSDLGVEDVKRMINLRRMISTDSVLREADPREVLEIYNSVSKLNPELAGNMPAIKLLLREAVSYDGLTLDSQKQLADIRKSTGDSEGKESDNERRRYAVNGGLPVGLTIKA